MMFKFTDGDWIGKAVIIWLVQFGIIAAVFIVAVVIVLKLLGV